MGLRYMGARGVAGGTYNPGVTNLLAQMGFGPGAVAAGYAGGGNAAAAQARTAANEARAQQIYRGQQSEPLAQAASGFLQSAISGAAVPYSAQVEAAMRGRVIDQAEAARRASVDRAGAQFAAAGLGRGGGYLGAQQRAARQQVQDVQRGLADVTRTVAPANFQAQMEAAGLARQQQLADVQRFQPELDVLQRQRFDVPDPEDVNVSFGGGGIGTALPSNRERGRSPKFGATVNSNTQAYQPKTYYSTLRPSRGDTGGTVQTGGTTTKSGTPPSGAWSRIKSASAPTGRITYRPSRSQKLGIAAKRRQKAMASSRYPGGSTVQNTLRARSPFF